MLDSKTKERIASDAKIHFRNDSIGQSIIDTLRRGYIAGGEAEAERAQPVIDALKQAIMVMGQYADLYNAQNERAALQQANETLAAYYSNQK